jgi:hypothetical protein
MERYRISKKVLELEMKERWDGHNSPDIINKAGHDAVKKISESGFGFGKIDTSGTEISNGHVL